MGGHRYNRSSLILNPGVNSSITGILNIQTKVPTTTKYHETEFVSPGSAKNKNSKSPNVIFVTMSNKNEFGGGGVRLKMRNREGVALHQACADTLCRQL